MSQNQSPKNMGLMRFLRFVEIETKAATLLPAAVALAYVFYIGGVTAINWHFMAIYFAAAVLLDMSITAINNHVDKREDKTQTPHYSSLVSIFIISAMLSVFAALGLYLVFSHDNSFTIFLAGGLCLFVGVTYTLGPAPISKSPYSEVASGFIAGVVIMFIVISLNDTGFDPLGMTLNIDNWRFYMDIDLLALAAFILIALPPTFCAANISLANNICDAERDRPFRYTLAHSLGIKKSLRLFAGLYYASFAAIIAAVALRTLSVWTLLAFAVLPLVQKNIRTFFKKQEKSSTFILAVKNFVLIMLSYAIGIMLGGFI